MWAVHVCAVEGEVSGPLEYETDRARFLHRGHNPRSPGAMRKDERLSNTVGPVPFGTPFTILCALTLASLVVGPFAAAAALRQEME